MSNTTILQLSDIHMGADYNGKFNTRDQFDAVIKSALAHNPGGYDAVIITGDIADEAVPEYYHYVFEEAAKLCKTYNGRLLVTPGNHDDRKTLVDEYIQVLKANMKNVEYYITKADEMLYPGKQSLITPLGERRIVLIDTGDNYIQPHEGIAGIYKRTSGDSDDKEMIVFTHRPCTAPGKLYHRFMKDMLSPESVLDELPDYVMHYFCGHIHHVAQFEQHGIKVSTAPGIQCQIDPYANECVAYPIPGYQVITFEGFKGSIVNIETVILGEEK